MAVDESGPTAKVAVKLAFSRDEKARLMEEHQVYSCLHSQDVQGIAHNIGLFANEEPLLDAEGPVCFGHIVRWCLTFRPS